MYIHNALWIYNCICVGARRWETEGRRAVGDEYESAGGSQASGSFCGCQSKCDSSAFLPIRARVRRGHSGNKHAWDW